MACARAGCQARVTSLPIWDIAVQTEGRASARVRAFAALVTDPLLRSCSGYGRGRRSTPQGRVVETSAGLTASHSNQSQITQYRATAMGMARDRYSECVDSFFAFGLFEVARRSGTSHLN